ncbi:hypothetical protein R1flu_015584 [Riccia fluitans]|uniref:DNA 3'-5' helicase n=1 Tax=Riccia fluitans TaxID=41844 RepID=A0ABD1YJK4_9MARC
MMASCGCTKMIHPVMRRVVWAPGKLASPLKVKPLIETGFGGVGVSSSSFLVNLRLSYRTFPVRITSVVPRGAGRRVFSALGLNEEQVAAVKTEANCVRVVAGPGSGKTLVLTCRIAHLIKNRGVKPSNMLCITFTNKAANELRERLRKLLGEELSAKLNIGTFHSICARILREVATKEEVGVDQDFVIYDEQDAGKVVKGILEEILNAADCNSTVNQDVSSAGLGSKKKSKLLTVASKEVQETLELIAGLKQFELKNFVLKRSNSSKVLRMPLKYSQVQHLAKRYENALRAYNAVDFDDLIYLTVRLFYLRNDVWEKYQKRWSYVLADEFQDTDVAQYILVRKLCMTNKNLFVVGDVDQAIYGWRGADYKNMQNLERHFPELTTLELRRNYRSSQSILTLASEIIHQSSRSNTSLRPLKLEPMKSGGSPVTVSQFDNADEEAKYVCNKIRSLIISKQASYKSFGILYRTRHQGQRFESAFIENGIPYSVSGATSLLSYKEIKDLRAYLQLVWNQGDGIALERVINTPPRGLGPTTIKKIRDWASERSFSLPQALQKISENQPSHKDLGITAKARKSLLEFCDLMKELVEISSSHDNTVGMLVEEILSRTKYLEHLEGSDENGDKRTGHIEEFQALANKHGCGRPALSVFLESIALNADSEEAGEVGGRRICELRLRCLCRICSLKQAFRQTMCNFSHSFVAIFCTSKVAKSSFLNGQYSELQPLFYSWKYVQNGKKLDTVKLSTLHAAKGLEFDYVFISGLEEGTLPHIRGDLDEERRLFYVGVTRAKNHLFITHRRRALVPDLGFRQTKVSSFLDLPKRLFKEERHESQDSWNSTQKGYSRGYAEANW